MIKNTYAPEEELVLSLSSTTETESTLILYNDDVTPFDFVIDSLVTVCQHSHLQAEQCALIAHNKGRCAIKTGAYKKMFDMQEALSLREIISEVETN